MWLESGVFFGEPAEHDHVFFFLFWFHKHELCFPFFCLFLFFLWFLLWALTLVAPVFFFKISPLTLGLCLWSRTPFFFFFFSLLVWFLVWFLAFGFRHWPWLSTPFFLFFFLFGLVLPLVEYSFFWVGSSLAHFYFIFFSLVWLVWFWLWLWAFRKHSFYSFIFISLLVWFFRLVLV